jgi:hypothetical protein
VCCLGYSASRKPGNGSRIGGFLGIGGHLVAVPYENLVTDETGGKIVLPNATKEELKKLPEFKYPA